ncbi:MAG: asparagine synthase C-terminal domain-containing protein [Candidatus Altiarchaeota archaeon]
MDDVDSILGELSTLLSSAVEGLCEEKTGVVFSSGVDSALIASLAAECCEIMAYAVGFEGSPDVDCARSVESELGFPVEYVSLSHDMIEDAVPEILGIVGEPNPVKVGVGIPFYYASKKAFEDGFSVMLCGQGGDELFGGYWRYVDAYVSEGGGKVVEMMKSDVKTADDDNLDRDRAVCRHNGVELRIPYIGEKFMEYVEGLPIDLKVREVDQSFSEFTCIDEVEGRRFVRKYVLRLLARKHGLPERVINRSKKAAQYGSAVNKHLEKIARKNGFQHTREYLESFKI